MSDQTTAPTPPTRLASRPRDEHGRIIPFYAVGHSEDPQVVRTVAARAAHEARRCFTCGHPLGAFSALTLTPAALITRATTEPPSHRKCAEYDVMGWMSVNHPAMHRQGFTVVEPDDETAPDDEAGPVMPQPGEGVVALFMTQEWSRQRGRDMYSFRAEFAVTWWTHGRPATYPEALAGLVSGLEILRAKADKDGDPARAHELLTKQYERALELLPGTDL